MKFLVVFLALAGLLLVPATVHAGEECEVCVKVLDTIFDTLSKDDMKDVSKIETAIESFCGSVDGWGGEKAQKMEPKEEKFCYVISPIKREVSKPATLGMPTKKVCEKASRIDEQICSLKYPAPPPDLATFTDEQFQKMRVKQLKELVTAYKKECKGCTEKSDYVDMLIKMRDAKTEL